GGAAAMSPGVALLTKSMVRAMFVKRLQMAAICVLALAGSGVGVALALRDVPRADLAASVEQAAAAEAPTPVAGAGAKPIDETVVPVRSLRGHTNRLTSVAFAPDGTSIATASWDGTARLWDAGTGKEVLWLESPYRTDHNTVDRVAFSPDNALVVTLMR